MLDYACQRATEILKTPHRAILATGGPAGVQAGEFPYEAVGLELYLLVPCTSDHLFNLEHDPSVTLLSTAWEVKGEAQILPLDATHPGLGITLEPYANWCRLVRIDPFQIQVRQEEGWGNLETLDLKPG